MTDNRLGQMFARDKKLFSIFVTAGFPTLEATVAIVETLAASGVDFIELGIPFSDSIADGAVIQRANEIALQNGASLQFTLETLGEIRARGVNIPVILMGSFNPVMQYGIEKFCAEASKFGADGVILPDLPLEFYQTNYQTIFEKYDLANVFLITSNTPDERVRKIDAASKSFIYTVSLSGVTGKTLQMDEERREYLNRLRNLDLRSPLIIGFGIETRRQFLEITEFSHGAIVGSAFLRAIENSADLKQTTRDFVGKFLS